MENQEMQMEKAYDGKALLGALEKEGIQGGIATAKKCVAVLASFLRSSAKMSTEGLVGKLDDFAVPGINYFEKLAVEKLSEIEAKLAAEAPVADEVLAAEAPVAEAAPSEVPSA